MKIKSYFSSSVEEAIHSARGELGDEAVLITSRRAPFESQHLGSYEVVFGTPPQAETPENEPQSQDLNSELAALREQLEGIKRVLQPSGANAPAYSEPAIDRVYQELLAYGFDSAHARNITDHATGAWRSYPPAQRASLPQSFEQLAANSLRQRLQFTTDYASAVEASRRTVVLCGPPGAGKTTTLAKIAIQEFLGRRMSVRVISVDPYRAGAHEKLRTLSAIIGLGFTAANTMREFIEAVDEFQNKDVLLVDTPGYAIREADLMEELAGALSKVDSKETHLVLPASMKREELGRYIRHYQAFAPHYLLFTKLDETESYGPVFSAAMEANKPLSFFGTGQGIPEDIELSNADTLLGSLFRRERAEAISAA